MMVSYSTGGQPAEAGLSASTIGGPLDPSGERELQLLPSGNQKHQGGDGNEDRRDMDEQRMGRDSGDLGERWAMLAE